MNSIFAFAYGRASSEIVAGVSRQEQSIEIQDKTFREYIRSVGIPAAAFGTDFERIFLERHTGAFTYGDLRNRPQGARLWHELELTRRDHPTAELHLIITKVDRFGRGWVDMMVMLRELRERLRVRLHIITLGGKAFDCDSMIGQKIVSDLAWIAEMEVQNTKARIHEAKANAKAKSEMLGGNLPPYGWDAVPTGAQRVNKGGKLITIKQLIPNETEQAWLLQMFQWRTLHHFSYGRIARELNARSVPTKTGAGQVMRVLVSKHRSDVRFTDGKWKPCTVQKVLNTQHSQAWFAQQQQRQPAAA